MQEVVDPLGLPGGAAAAVRPVLIVEVGLRLRQLVLVVRERQIRAARVDVHALPQHLTRHGRALYVPTCMPWSNLSSSLPYMLILCHHQKGLRQAQRVECLEISLCLSRQDRQLEIKNLLNISM